MMSWSSIDASVAHIVPICIPFLKLLTDHYTLRKFIPFVCHYWTKRFFSNIRSSLFFTTFMNHVVSSQTAVIGFYLQWWIKVLGAGGNTFWGLLLPPLPSSAAERLLRIQLRGPGDLFKIPSGVRARSPGRRWHLCILRAYTG